MERILETLSLQVERRLMELGIAGKTLTLKVRWSTFELVTRATSRTQGFQSAQEMLPVLRTMLSGLAENKRAVRLLGVIVSGLISPDEIRRARQVVTPSLWWDEHMEAEAESSQVRGKRK
jgi:DNA polymerase-4